MLRFHFILIVGFFSSLAAHGQCLDLHNIDQSEPFNASTVRRQEQSLPLELLKALTAFEETIGTAHSETRKSWEEYLHWDEWAQPFLETRAVNLRAMKRMGSLFYNTAPGFDNPSLKNLRAALQNYVNFMDARQNLDMNGIEQLFYLQLDKLNRFYHEPECDFAKLDEILSWLVVMKQAPSLVKTIQSKFDHPSLVINTDRSMIDDALTDFKKTKNESKSSVNNIQGAWVSGRSDISAQTSAEIKDARNASIRVHIAGTVNSPNNVGTRKSVHVYSSAITHWTSFSDIFWDGNKIAFTSPHVQADTRSSIKSVEAPFIIRRIAKRRVAKQKRAGEIQGANIIASQVEDEMNDELKLAVKDLDAKTADIRTLLARTGMLPLPVGTRIVGRSFKVDMYPQSTSGIGAGVWQSHLEAEPGTFILSAHETSVGNLVRNVLAGSRWTDIMFAHLQKEMTGTNTQEYMIGLTKERWSAEWDWHSPIQVEFSQAGMTFSFRYSSIRIDDFEYDEPYAVQSTFNVENTPLGLEFKRVSAIRIYSLRDNIEIPPAVESFIVRKFNGLFDDVFYLDGLHFPQGGDLDDLSKMKLEQVETNDHWIHMKISAPAFYKAKN